MSISATAARSTKQDPRSVRSCHGIKNRTCAFSIAAPAVRSSQVTRVMTLEKDTGVFVQGGGGRVAPSSFAAPLLQALSARIHLLSAPMTGARARKSVVALKGVPRHYDSHFNSTNGWQCSRYHSPNSIRGCSLLLIQESYIMLEANLKFDVDSVVLL